MTNKRKFSHSNNAEDLISKLPDILLTYVLSFTDTRSAIVTTILSKRWYGLWTSVPNLDFSFFWYEVPAKKARLEGFVDHVLISNKVRSVRTISFSGWKTIETARLNSWLADLAGRDAGRVNLSFPTPRPYRLPDCFFDKQNLVELSLSNFICRQVPRSVSFPSLMKIHFINIRLRYGDDSFRHLMSGCPVLTWLHMEIREWDHRLTLDITSSTLLTLFITINIPLNDFRPGVVIDAPNLNKIQLIDYTCRVNYDIRDVTSLADVYLSFKYGGQVLCEVLKKMIHATKLDLNFNSDTLNCSLENLPMFRNLINMTLLITKDEHRKCVFRLLQCTPNLVTFVFDEYGDDAPDSILEEPNEVPHCLVSSLKSVEMLYCNVENVKKTMQMVSYILKSATVLETMYVNISFIETELENEFRTTLSTLQKGSAKCQVTYEDFQEYEDRVNGVIKQESDCED